MSNSLLTGVSGLRAHQEMLDVVGNNLANANTTGFKAQRLRFSDLVYQTLNQAAGAAAGDVGGVNPIQVGLGTSIAAVDVNLQQGSLESTQSPYDLALQGSGFFVVRNGIQDSYTRVGAFNVDSNNYLVDPSTGYRVQRFGTVGEGSATSPAFQTPGNEDIKVPIGSGIPGRATSIINLQGNLSASALGPLAQILKGGNAFHAGGVPATTSTLLNSLDDNPLDYVTGDKIHLQGNTASNAPVNALVSVDGTTTLGDLVSAINSNFTGSNATLDSSGNLVIQDNAAGPSFTSLGITDDAANTGFSNWGTHAFDIATAGKDGDKVSTGIQFYDSQGTPHNLSLEFQKTGNNMWNLKASIPSSDGAIIDGQVDGISFNDDGSFRAVGGTGLGDSLVTVQVSGVTTTQSFGFGFGSANAFNGLTQVGGTSSAVAKDQDGFSAGFLTDASISQDGVINGIFTNGRVLPIGQLAVASFANPGALLRQGNNYFGLSSESGSPLIGAGLSGGRGSIQQKSLESSNVDVALEFTRLIIAQRGFQVNARTITASDQVLQELANIIR